MADKIGLGRALVTAEAAGDTKARRSHTDRGEGNRLELDGVGRGARECYWWRVDGALCICLPVKYCGRVSRFCRLLPVYV